MPGDITPRVVLVWTVIPLLAGFGWTVGCVIGGWLSRKFFKQT